MYTKKAHIHFVGIGGIGMSGIATILKHQGYHISGCDADLDQKSIKNLIALDCTVAQGNNTPLCNDASIDILVYSSAIKAHNPEIVAAQQRGIPTIPRGLMLAELMRTKYSIAIGGSHGKTTTTSLIAHILIEAQLDPTVVIGGHLKNISNNARIGGGNFLVAETDESDRSLLHLHATLAVITNIDLEHLETYKDINDIRDTFKQFLNNVPFYGKAILCIDDPQVRTLFPLPHIKTIKYGFTKDADMIAQDLNLEPNHSTFTVWKNGHLLGSVHHAMPGRHNVLNALAAITAALDLEIPFDTICKALATFKGIERRFSFRGTYKGAEIFDDYGHHPNEILNTLLVARKRSKKRLTVVFQPHRYTRTDKLWHEFIAIFAQSSVDHLIVTDIYPASEQPIANVTGENLAKAIKQEQPPFSISYVPYDADFSSIKQQLDPLVEQDDLILLLGAGKITKLAEFLA